MWDTMIGEYPSLEGKSESVAFITWVLKNNPDIEPAALREAGAKAGVPVAGRAIGSARETLGISKPKPKGKKAGKKKGGAKKTGGRKARATSSGIAGMADVMNALETLKGMERQNQQMRGALEKIRDVINKALDE